MRLARQFWSSKTARLVAGVILGGVGGGLYAHYVGCLSGGCPITSNPVLSGLFGAFLGASLLMPATEPAAPAEDGRANGE